MDSATVCLLAVLMLFVIGPIHARDALEVALYTGKGISQGSAKALSQIVRDAPDMHLHRIEASDLRLEALRKFDLVIFPGGSATQQAKAIGERGRAEVNRFVRNGGGYLGICAGAYLASSGFPLSCDLIKPSGKHRKPGKPETKSGMSKQKVELTKKGRALFPNLPAHFQITCVAGPTFPLSKNKRPPPYQPLGIFRTQTASGRGAVVGDAAIVISELGSGRVMAISPHPELSRGLGSMVPNAIRWIAKREPVTLNRR